MFGLAVRWSLAQATPQIEQKLRDYVADESFAKFAELPDLHQKTWRMVSGAYFEGIYVFADLRRPELEGHHAARRRQQGFCDRRF